MSGPLTARRRLVALGLGLVIGVPLAAGLQLGGGPARAAVNAQVATTLPTLPVPTTAAPTTTTTAPATTTTAPPPTTPTTPTTAAAPPTTAATPTTLADQSSADLPGLSAPTLPSDSAAGSGASSTSPSSSSSSSSSSSRSSAPSTAPVVATAGGHGSPWARVLGLAALLIALVLYSEGYGILGGRIKSLSSRPPRRMVPPRS